MTGSALFKSLLLILILVSIHLSYCGKKDPVSPNDTQPVETIADESIIPETVGFNIHITGPESDLDRIKESGIKIVRKDLFWDTVERSKSTYDFSRYDRLLGGLEKRRIRVLFILCYGNSLYPNPENTEEGRRAYARFAAEAVSHYKDHNVLWEIWNEPNVEHFWNGPGTHNSAEFADQYIELVKTVVPAMREANPECYIIGGSVSCLWVNSFHWLDRCFKQDLLESGINALSVHPYGFARPELCIEEGYGYLRMMLNKYGASADFPVLNTEVGYNAEEEYLGPSYLRLEHQAWHFVRQYLVDLMCGIKMTIWYNWNDDFGFRLVDDDMSALPVFNACQILIEQLSGYHYVERIYTDSTVDYILVFKNESGKRKLVCWTTPTNRDDTPEKARRHSVSLTVDTKTDVVDLYDIYGEKSSTEVVQGEITLSVSGSPLYIDLDNEPK